LALPPPLPCRTEILLFLEIFFRSLPCQESNRPAIVGISRFSGRYAEKCRKTKVSIVRLGAVRAHSVNIGPDMHCCRTARPMRDLHSLPFHYRSGAMRTELGDQQYYGVGANRGACLEKWPMYVQGVRRMMCHSDFKNTSSYDCDASIPQAAHGKNKQHLFYLFLS